MPSSDVVGDIRRAVAARETAANAAFDELVQAAADGRPVDADDAADAIREAGKTAGDFEAAVRVVAKRREMRAVVATRPQVDAERQRATADLTAADAERAALEARLAPRIAAAHHTLTVVVPARDRAILDAEQWLAKNDPAAVAERKRAERLRLIERIAEARSGRGTGPQIDRLEAELAALDAGR